MYALRNLPIAIAILLGVPLALALGADAPAPAEKSLLDLTAGNANLAKILTPSCAQVTAEPSKNPATPGLVVTIQPGKDNYPGVAIKPAAGGAWDLSRYGHVEIRATNLGSKPLGLVLRVDNAGDWRTEPWNTEQSTIEPGQTGTITTMFGYSYGRKPGFKLNAAKVVQALVFATKSDAVQSFRIDSIEAAGTAGEAPPVDPMSMRVKPKGGVLLGAGIVIDPEKQIEAQGAKAAIVSGKKPGIQVTFDGGSAEAKVALKPTFGQWDLRDAMEVKVRMRNTGSAPIAPRVRLECNGAPMDWITSADPLSPGGERELTIDFAGAVPWRVVKRDGELPTWSGAPHTGSHITSDAVSA
ncbi:MAG TPA: hypothetical protein VFC46_04370, partial [Humisphaera sp.]|nr:hypothetical protein [Humisphaera sp.]